MPALDGSLYMYSQEQQLLEVFIFVLFLLDLDDALG